MSTELFEIKEHQIDGQYIREYPGATRNGEEATLKLAVKQYIPRVHPDSNVEHASKSVTVIAASGNGFPKELYDPLWTDLLALSNDKAFTIKSIWIADMTHQGKSGLLNKDHIGSDPSWSDHSRDLLTLINHFRKDMTAPLIGIGHSIGANALINLGIFHPRLFSNLILFEPILAQQLPDGSLYDCSPEGAFFANIASKKPDTWPSRAAAEMDMSNSKPWKDWDPRVFKTWLDHGLRKTEKGVELVTSGAQEAITYDRPLFNPQEPEGSQQLSHPDLNPLVKSLGAFYCPGATSTLLQLPSLRPRTLFITGGKSVMFPPGKLDQIFKITGTAVGGSGGNKVGAVHGVNLEKQGHLLPFETPSQCAELVAVFVDSEMKESKPPVIVSSIDRNTGELTGRWRRELAKELGRMKSKTKAKI